MKVVHTHGAQLGRVDVNYTTAGELMSIGCRQVDMAIRVGKFRELAGNLGSYLVAALADSRSDGGVEVFRLARELPVHFCNGMSGDPLRRPAPACMRGSHGSVARINQQNRDTLRRLDGNEAARRVFHQGIALTQATRAASSIHHNI